MNNSNYSPRAPEWWVKEHYQQPSKGSSFAAPRQTALAVLLLAFSLSVTFFDLPSLNLFIFGFILMLLPAKGQKSKCVGSHSPPNPPAVDSIRLTNNKIIADKNAEYGFIVGDKTEAGESK